jgi:hypothetical protein
MPSPMIVFAAALTGLVIIGFCLAFLVPVMMRAVFASEAKLYPVEMEKRFRSWGETQPVRDRILDALFSGFAETGFFPTYLRPCLQGDPRYPAQAMGEDFARDGDIRWLVALFALPQLCGRREKPDPFSLRIDPGMPLVARMDFCLFNVLIAERLWIASETSGGLPAPRRDEARRILDAVIGKLLDPPGGFAPGHEFLYKVSFDPAIRNRDLNGMMREWSAYSDSDSSAYALSLFARYLGSRRGDDAFLALSARVREALERTPYLEKLATVFLPAHDYTLPAARASLPAEAHAFMTYFTAGANDADPVVNMDILEALARNWSVWKLSGNAPMLSKIRAVLGYIRGLAENGSLFRLWVHQYYTAPACAFLWKRYHEAFLDLDADQRARFDPEGATAVIDAALEAHWNAYAASDPGFSRLEDLDLALIAAAFPDRRPAKARLSAWLTGTFARTAPPGCREFFCAVYPVKVIYGSPWFMLALVLPLCMEGSDGDA